MFNLITLQLGNDLMVSIKARPSTPGRSASEIMKSMNAVEAELRRRYPQVRWSFLEPDLTD